VFEQFAPLLSIHKLVHEAVLEPRMTTLGKLAQALEVDPAELVED
jgi:hypothetical protein